MIEKSDIFNPDHCENYSGLPILFTSNPNAYLPPWWGIKSWCFFRKSGIFDEL